ncbi:TPA_asm: hypothetical protein vir335_00108 [Classicovirus victor]|uniref:Uncharacterized protein n=1 Tax=Caudoviricetes sp. vir335 TaxID=3068357 RepID=A0AA87CDZ0_9CAUD|nr:TPA_asm: hypothetical protein vir335_00108 [Caudoviricetes sp. vir335]
MAKKADALLLKMTEDRCMALKMSAPSKDRGMFCQEMGWDDLAELWREQEGGKKA